MYSVNSGTEKIRFAVVDSCSGPSRPPAPLPDRPDPKRAAALLWARCRRPVPNFAQAGPDDRRGRSRSQPAPPPSLGSRPSRKNTHRIRRESVVTAGRKIGEAADHVDAQPSVQIHDSQFRPPREAPILPTSGFHGGFGSRQVPPPPRAASAPQPANRRSLPGSLGVTSRLRSDRCPPRVMTLRIDWWACSSG